MRHEEERLGKIIRTHQQPLHDALTFIRETIFHELPGHTDKGKGKGGSFGLSYQMHGYTSGAGRMITWDDFITELTEC
eukprot:12740681-Heterocapsa_arctica.AAC.1